MDIHVHNRGRELANEPWDSSNACRSRIALPLECERTSLFAALAAVRSRHSPSRHEHSTSTFSGGPQLAATLRRRAVEWIGAWRNLRHGGKRRGRCERGEERVLSSTKRKRKRHGDGVLLSLKESETSVRSPKGLRPKETGCGNRRVSRQGGPEVTEGHVGR